MSFHSWARAQEYAAAGLAATEARQVDPFELIAVARVERAIHEPYRSSKLYAAARTR